LGKELLKAKGLSEACERPLGGCLKDFEEPSKELQK
jgi:hypothetical protein